MALFANNTKKVKTAKVKPSKSKPAKVKPAKEKSTVQKRKSRFSNEGVETVVEVKTVGDIPPVLEAKKFLGENDLGSAAKVLFKASRDDYVKFFSVANASSDGNRHFLISELSSFKIKVPEMGYVDNTTIMSSFDKLEANGDDMSNRINALKKLASFYLDYYEKARYSIDNQFDGEDMISNFSEIYNYMDIMRLYFSRNLEV